MKLTSGEEFFDTVVLIFLTKNSFYLRQKHTTKKSQVLVNGLKIDQAIRACCLEGVITKQTVSYHCNQLRLKYSAAKREGTVIAVPSLLSLSNNGADLDLCDSEGELA